MRKLIVPVMLLSLSLSLTLSLSSQESSSVACSFSQAAEVMHVNQIKTHIYPQRDQVVADSEYALCDINGRTVATGVLNGLKIGVDLPSGIFVLTVLGVVPTRALIVIQK